MTAEQSSKRRQQKPASGTTDPARGRLLTASLEAFTERGIFATQIQEICRRAGASVGSLYHHFGDKEGLAGELFVDALDSFQRAFVAAIRAHEEAEGGVRAGVAAQVRWSLRDATELARFLYFHGDAARGSAPERLASQNREFFRAVLGWLRPHVRYGAVRDLDLDLAYSLWLGPSMQFCRLALAGRTDVSIKRATEVLSEGAWLALREGG